MSNHTYSHEKIWVAIDCLVFGFDQEMNNLQVLCFKRPVEPFAGQWSLIGGFVDIRESIDQAARRILHQFTGLEGHFLKQLEAFGQLDRDPGGRVISLLYWSLIRLNATHRATTQSYEAEWFRVDELPPLVLDHRQMIELGRKKLMQQTKFTPIGFELLPEKFTLPQLRQMYEALLGKELDDRNFRKRIVATNLLLKLPVKDMRSSRKGAFLYRFDIDKYEELTKKGYHLDLGL